MDSKDEINNSYQKAKLFWSNVNKNNLLSNFNQIKNAFYNLNLNLKYEKELSHIRLFLNNLVEPTILFDTIESYKDEIKLLKENDEKLRKQIEDLKALNSELNLKLEDSNKIVTSYQNIQFSMLGQIRNLKKFNEEKATNLDVQRPSLNAPIVKNEMLIDKASTIDRSSALATLPNISLKSISNRAHSALSTINSKSSTKSAANLAHTAASQILNSSSSSDDSSIIENYKSRRLTRKQQLIEYDSSNFNAKCLEVQVMLKSIKNKLKSASILQHEFYQALFGIKKCKILHIETKLFRRCSTEIQNMLIKAYLWLKDPDGIKKIQEYNEGTYDPNDYIPSKRRKYERIKYDIETDIEWLTSDSDSDGNINNQQLKKQTVINNSSINSGKTAFASNDIIPMI